MKGETHELGGCVLQSRMRLPSTILFAMLKPSLPNVIAIYLLHDAITLPTVITGAVLPDYDSDSPDSTPNRILPPFDKHLYRILKRWGATHRSSHTHNLDLWLIILGIPTFLLLGMFINTKEDLWYYLFLRSFALLYGVLSHQFLDTLTVTGITPSHIHAVITKRPKVMRVIPHHRTMYRTVRVYVKGLPIPLYRLRKVEFDLEDWGRTGGGWESYLYKRLNYDNFKTREWIFRLKELAFILLVFSSLLSS